jgi:hypothetical protein
MKSTFEFKLDGFPAANRDAVIQLVNESTGQQMDLKPFLDGSLTVRDLDAGAYQVVVKHPNSIVPIYQSRVRLFDQRPPTFVPIRIDPGVFQVPPTPPPLSDLSPVQQAAASVKDRVTPIGSKSQGEVIRSADWNTLVAAVSDPAAAVQQLTGLVAPLGHTHPELDQKIGQVQDALNGFAQSFGRAQLQYQRMLEVTTFRQLANQVLTAGQATDAESKQLTDKLDDLAQAVDTDSTSFTTKLTAASNQALVTINTLAVRVPNFPSNPAVQQLQSIARQHADLGVQFDPRNEILHYVGGNNVALRLKTVGSPLPFGIGR